MEASTPLLWSSPFSVLPPETPSCKDLPGDKIILPQSALEQLLRAVSLQPSFIPQHAFYSENENTQLPNPLMFRLTNTKNNNQVYAGIKEFSAPEGMVGLSPFLSEALKIELDDCVAFGSGSHEEPVDLTISDAVFSKPSKIVVRAVPLPKGTYVRLRPLEAGYNPDDWKPLLERQLRQSFTSLTMNTVLSVRGVRGEEFKLLVDKVTPEGGGICVVDTDLLVDIEALDEEQARETMRQIISKGNAASADGSSSGGELDIWKDVDGRILPGDYVDYILPSWDRSQELSITLSGIVDESGLDLFVTPKSRQQRALPRDSVHIFGDFSPARHGSKTITISPTNIELEAAESILISVHAYHNSTTARESTSPISYTIRARADPVRGNTIAEPIEIDGQNHSSNEEQCKNCQQWVPKQSMILHQNFCLRNNVLCPRCKSVFKKGSAEWDSHWHCDDHDAHGNSPASKAKHDEVFHTHRQCPSCEFSTDSLPELAHHRTSTCPGKIILCRFCHLEVPQEGDPFNINPEVVLSGLTAHELADGARTTECHLCDKIVRLRDMETHMKHHELDKSYRLKPKICRNVNCGRTLLGVGPKGQIGANGSQQQQNDLGFCPACFGPLYVSLYDPQKTALRRRVERRYLSQLMTGCGKSYCANEWCKTGRSNTGLEARASSVGQLSSLIQPLLSRAFDADAPAYFCVDETSQAGRKAAEMVAAQKGWDLEWCVAAGEAEKGNIDKMMDWLNGWAPKRVPE